MIELDLNPLTDAIEYIVLRRTHSGDDKISEFELIRLLQSEEYALLSTDALRDELTMFQTHFIVFHCLYQLRRRWREERSGDLQISALAIGWMKPVGIDNIALPANDDPLERYYLNLQELTLTGQDDVENLLSQFWQRYAGLADTETEADSLRIMQLQAMPDSQQELRRHYFSCLHQRHPDKGGNTEDVCQLISAYKHLSKRMNENIRFDQK